ncbi:MAG: AraC family transcriptional regulator [Minwuiales bacterium]|nr:AraC family transcriptional regulator [Minwuiales bacterium]
MVADQSTLADYGLERLCDGPDQGWFRSVEPARGVELFEAWFAGHAYDKHRHDTYAVGVTETGVQAFDYRGASVRATAGNVVAIYPDEVHDGHAGTEQGFGYRMIYLEPAKISEAVGSITGERNALPFIRDTVSTNAKLAAAIRDGFRHHHEPLAVDSLVLQLAEGLVAGGSGVARINPGRRLDLVALDRARQFLDAETARVVRSSELETITGLRRYDLARQFRSLYGTSPYRYSLMRRLDSARRRIGANRPLAELALDSGFADQAHFTRMFKAAYGMSPARYRLLKVGNFTTRATEQRK